MWFQLVHLIWSEIQQMQNFMSLLFTRWHELCAEHRGVGYFLLFINSFKILGPYYWSWKITLLKLRFGNRPLEYSQYMRSWNSLGHVLCYVFPHVLLVLLPHSLNVLWPSLTCSPLPLFLLASFQHIRTFLCDGCVVDTFSHLWKLFIQVVSFLFAVFSHGSYALGTLHLWTCL